MLPQKPLKLEIERPKIERNIFFSKKIFSVSLIVIIFSTFYFLFVENDSNKREYAIIPDLPENYISIVEEANLNNITEKKVINKNNENLENNIISSSSAIASSSKINDEESKIITLKILNPTWLQIRDSNNKIVLSQLMNKSDEYSYESDLKYSITSGNAGHILVLINQKVRGKIGKKGQVVDSLVLDNNFKN